MIQYIELRTIVAFHDTLTKTPSVRRTELFPLEMMLGKDSVVRFRR